MMNRFRPAFLALPMALAFSACSSSTTSSSTTSPDAGAGDAAASDAGGGSGGTQCTAARAQSLLPIDKVSSAGVGVVSTSGGSTLIFVDASAGGPQGAAKAPRVYVNLESFTRVALTDTQAFTSGEWDLALKRTVIYTNSGDAGTGTGGGAEIDKPFSSVTAADVAAATIAPESFFDDQCTAKVDPIGAPLTSFSNWYNYDQATNIPTPKNITYIVRGGTGKLYKVGITSYSGLADGGTGQTTGYFLLEVAPL